MAAQTKAKALFHDRTRFPRHPHLPQNKSGKCNPCVRYEVSPMSRVAQIRSSACRELNGLRRRVAIKAPKEHRLCQVQSSSIDSFSMTSDLTHRYRSFYRPKFAKVSVPRPLSFERFGPGHRIVLCVYGRTNSLQAPSWLHRLGSRLRAIRSRSISDRYHLELAGFRPWHWAIAIEYRSNPGQPRSRARVSSALPG